MYNLHEVSCVSKRVFFINFFKKLFSVFLTLIYLTQHKVYPNIFYKVMHPFLSPSDKNNRWSLTQIPAKYLIEVVMGR